MPEVETVAAESSPVVETAAPQVDPLQEGPMVTWTREQRNEFRTTGKMPEMPKADPAPAKTEAQAESAAESETAKPQEHTPKPKQTAEERIAQLEATIEKIRKGAGIERTAKPESSTIEPKPESKPAQPQNYQEWRKTFKAPQWVEEFSKKNPEATYEDANAAMADYLADVRDGFKQRQAQSDAQNREIQGKIAEAKTRYPDFDQVIKPMYDALASDAEIPHVVKAMLNDSEILPDLAFAIASKPEELASFIKMAKEETGKAIRYIALMEPIVREELEGKKAPVQVEKPPVKQQTLAPKPPAEVGGRANAPGDSLVAAAAAGDFRSFKAEINRRALASRKTG